MLMDYKKIKKSGLKKVLKEKGKFLDLYKLSEVTETVYFNFLREEEARLER